MSNSYNGSIKVVTNEREHVKFNARDKIKRVIKKEERDGRV